MATKTLLDATNQVLVRLGLIAGDSGLLTSLTDSARQVWIDVAKQVINESISELYTVSELPMPNEQAESTITLVTGTRFYTLATDLVQLRWPLRDKTHTQFIHSYPDGYNGLLDLDPEQDNTGQPHWGAIRPTDGKLHLDVAPTSAENGHIYTYQYDKSLLLSSASDTVPFKDDVFAAMVPFWTEMWKRAQRQSFDADLAKGSFGRASRLLTQVQQRSGWSPR